MPDTNTISSRPVWRAALLAGLLATTALTGLALPGLAAPANEAPPAAAAQHVPDFADLVARVTPAVVSITTELRPRMADDATPRPGRRGAKAEARGSGFIVDAEGTVVTNAHVVSDARTVRVTLADGTELPARVIGRDTRTDLAVLKISADHKLPWLELGHSSEVRPGEWVVAVGNPFGLGGSVTAGIVSARGRDIGAGPYDDFLQVDAPINQGNSGGPLFTQDGRVVGVNTAILSPSGGSIGIGFAIPADKVRTVVAALQRDGHVTRGYLGIETQTLDAALAAALHLPSIGGAPGAAGALVATVSPGSPAEQAGLHPGDVIQAVNGKQIANPRELAANIADGRPGAVVGVAVLRDGEKRVIDVTLSTQPQSEKVASVEEAAPPPSLGVALAGITPELRDRLDLPAETRGVIVTQVAPDSPAELAGLRQGDVVLGVGPQAVGSPAEAVRAIRSATKSGKSVALRIFRDGQTGFVAVAPGKTAAAPDQRKDLDADASG